MDASKKEKEAFKFKKSGIVSVVCHDLVRLSFIN